MGTSASKTILSEIDSLTFYKDRLTTARRLPTIPQMKCLNNYDISDINTIYCNNKGSNGHGLEWECRTDIDGKYKFGKIDISCEGYDSSDDPYILDGSCAIEYTLESRNKLTIWSFLKAGLSVTLFVLALSECVRNPDKYPSQDFMAGAMIGSVLMYSSRNSSRYIASGLGTSKIR